MSRRKVKEGSNEGQTKGKRKVKEGSNGVQTKGQKKVKERTIKGERTNRRLVI